MGNIGHLRILKRLLKDWNNWANNQPGKIWYFLLNLFSTILGAVLVLLIALLIYQTEGKNRCFEQLTMMQYECKLNLKVFQQIITNLQFIHKQGEKIYVQPTVLRLMTDATDDAARSEYISRYVPIDLRKHIFVSCHNLKKLNRELISFNNFLYSRIDNPKASFSYLDGWRKNLENETEKVYAHSQYLLDQITSFLQK